MTSPQQLKTFMRGSMPGTTMNLGVGDLCLYPSFSSSWEDPKNIKIYFSLVLVKILEFREVKDCSDYYYWAQGKAQGKLWIYQKGMWVFGKNLDTHQSVFNPVFLWKIPRKWEQYDPSWILKKGLLSPKIQEYIYTNLSFVQEDVQLWLAKNPVS